MCEIVWGLRLTTSLVRSSLGITFSTAYLQLWTRKERRKNTRVVLHSGEQLAIVSFFLFFLLLKTCVRVMHLLLKIALKIECISLRTKMIETSVSFTIQNYTIKHLLFTQIQRQYVYQLKLITWVFPTVCSKVIKRSSGPSPVAHHTSLSVSTSIHAQVRISALQYFSSLLK